jgi:uncharacterized damage-inducible protein DinB
MRPPVTSDPLSILRGHNRWATTRVLELCRGLTPAQFHERFEIGPGSLHETLAHIVDCMRWWADHVSGRPPRPTIVPPAARLSVDELSRLLDEADAELSDLVEQSRSALDAPVHAVFGDKRFTFTRGVALTHAFVHGTHHRAQCLNMLRRLNVPGTSDRLPDIDVNDWQYETECKP